MGAILLDTGFDLNYVWEIMLSLVDPTSSFSKLQLNSVRELHEFCQSYGWDLKFHKIKNDGQSGIEAEVIGKDVSTSASATNRPIKTAKEMAAEHTLKLLRVSVVSSSASSITLILFLFFLLYLRALAIHMKISCSKFIRFKLKIQSIHCTEKLDYSLFNIS